MQQSNVQEFVLKSICAELMMALEIIFVSAPSLLTSNKSLEPQAGLLGAGGGDPEGSRMWLASATKY